MSTPAPEFQAVSLRTAGDMIGVHEDTLRAAIKAKKLPARKVGRFVRVEVSDLIAWFRSQESVAK